MRTATLSEAQAVIDWDLALGNQQPDTDDLESYFGGTDAWTRVGDQNSTGGPDGSYDFEALVDISGGSDGWGGHDVFGTWSFDDSFWDTYAEAVITIHVGGGPTDPHDHFAWVIVDRETAGDFSYGRISGGGGGFSNMQLWGRGDGSPVPEPGSLALLGLGLAGLAARRRRARA